MSLWDFRHCDRCRRGGCIVMSCLGEDCPCARKHPDAHDAEAEIEVTPKNAQQLVAEGKITIYQAREAHGLPPFEPPHNGFARTTPRAWDWPVGGPGCPGCAP